MPGKYPELSCLHWYVIEMTQKDRWHGASRPCLLGLFSHDLSELLWEHLSIHSFRLQDRSNWLFCNNAWLICLSSRAEILVAYKPCGERESNTIKTSPD